jgi:hypothetical protein
MFWRTTNLKNRRASCFSFIPMFYCNQSAYIIDNHKIIFN